MTTLTKQTTLDVPEAGEPITPEALYQLLQFLDVELWLQDATLYDTHEIKPLPNGLHGWSFVVDPTYPLDENSDECKYVAVALQLTGFLGPMTDQDVEVAYRVCSLEKASIAAAIKEAIKEMFA